MNNETSITDMRKLLLIGMMTFWACMAMAQEEYHIKVFGQTDELKVRGQVCMANINGFLWVGTSTGMIVFDGQHAAHYIVPDEEGLGGFYGRVVAILQSPDGNIWVGTRRGIYSFDITTEKLRPFKVKGLSKHPYVSALQSDNKGHLWGIIDGRAYCINLAEKRAECISGELMNPSCLTVANNGTVWMGDKDGTLYRYDTQEKRIRAYDMKQSGAEKFTNIVTIVEMKKNELALLSQTDGVCLFSPNNFSSRMLFTKDDEGVPMVAHTAITPEGDNLWVGTERGIIIYRMKDGRLTSIRQSRHKENSLSDNAVHSLMTDRERGVWVGTFFGGINRISYSHQNLVVTIPEKDNVDVCREICADNQGRLWVGTEDGGLYQFDRNTKTLHEADVKWGSENPPANVQSLMVLGDELWVSALGGGVYVIDTQTLTVKHHYVKTNKMGMGSLLTGVSLCHQKGTIFLSTNKNVYVFDEKEEAFNPLPEMMNTYAHHLYADPQGNVWVATRDKGLWKIQQKNGQWKAVQTPFAYKGTTFVMQDSRGLYRVGTDNCGMYTYNDQTGKSLQLKVSEELSHQAVNSIVEDLMHNLWINTFNGLYSYNTDTGLIFHLTTANGLPTDNLNYSASYVDHDGKVYIGTYKGLVSFVPIAFSPTPEKLTPFFLNLYVNGKHVLPGDSTKILRNTLFLTKEVMLKYNQNTFSLIYAIPSYQSNRIVWYRYRLNPDEPWMITDKNEALHLANLAPGHYEIALQASYDPESWEGETATIEVSIAPPTWLSGGALLGYVVIIILIVVMTMTFIRKKKEIIRKRKEREKAKREKEKEKKESEKVNSEK